ncbi:TrgA family protein [Phaeovulum vinaykumarii]|uniref:Tellurium resistance protein n=2 Tax=Phaeovulum vinaykumarii TaxID=407234 RepID=A0A1N7L7S3_9RHOB|nr:TrgA family protein [Phaeovulum vinaykumarii]SIS69912.1 hypothetical protein SAMN05421795_102665 [Phaeovulum vinaykumarii]SOB99246.1 hypothetical protein SAMN05878426_102107 [Phaeovulum vinaykumarii]
MPTAAKLVAALLMAATGASAAEIVVLAMAEVRNVSWLPGFVALVGLFMGWTLTGDRVGRGYLGAVSMGLQGMVMTVLGALLGVSFAEMIALALRRRYDAPMEALVDVVGLALRFSEYLRDPRVLAMLLAGGIVTGVAAEWAARRWR